CACTSSSCENCASCARNCVSATGSNGFWFLSCVVSRFMNSCELTFAPLPEVPTLRAAPAAAFRAAAVSMDMIVLSLSALDRDVQAPALAGCSVNLFVDDARGACGPPRGALECGGIGAPA